MTSSDASSAPLADAASSGALVAVAASLHQLEVVVAERPEEASRSARARACSCSPRGRSSTRGRASRAPSAARDRPASVTGPCGAGLASTNFDAFSSLIASRRPTFIWPVSNAVSVPGPAAGRPVAHAVGAVLLEQAHRRDDVALRLRHLLAIGIEHPAGDRGVAATAARRARAASAARVENSQVRMMSCACGRRSIGNTRANRSVVLVPAAGDLRRERRRRPGVHDVLVAGEAAGLIALSGAIAVRHVGRWIDRQPRLVGHQPRVVIDACRPRGPCTRPGTARRRSAAG